MKSCYEHMKLPQPVLPAVQNLTLWVGTTRFIDGGLPLYPGVETGA